MAKWYGKIGYSRVTETSPGIWEESITERTYFGEVIKNSSRWSTSSTSTNDDINVNNRISIIADQFAYENFHAMRYIEYMGAKWKITDIEVLHPRLVINMGGLYNGEQAETTE